MPSSLKKWRALPLSKKWEGETPFLLKFSYVNLPKCLLRKQAHMWLTPPPPPDATCFGTTRHLCITCISSSCGRSTACNSSTKIV